MLFAFSDEIKQMKKTRVKKAILGISPTTCKVLRPTSESFDSIVLC